MWEAINHNFNRLNDWVLILVCVEVSVGACLKKIIDYCVEVLILVCVEVSVGA